MTKLTHGQCGISNIPHQDLIYLGGLLNIIFDSRLARFYLVVAFLTITVIIVYPSIRAECENGAGYSDSGYVLEIAEIVGQ